MDTGFRAVEPRDHASTRRLVDEAFRPEDVATFLDRLRVDGCILGEWLAEERGEPVGHIAFSRVRVEQPQGNVLDAAMLTPLAVRPDRQRSGIGTALMKHALRALEERGETAFFVLGYPEYYPRVGFRSDAASKISSPWENSPAFMARAPSVLEGRLVLPAVIAEAHSG